MEVNPDTKEERKVEVVVTEKAAKKQPRDFVAALMEKSTVVRAAEERLKILK